jgi:pimeloyl-ACP methyl ester carboxylesterase
LRLPLLLLAVVAACFGQSYELLRVEANPQAGFEWPYFLLVPSPVQTPLYLVVMPNNTGVIGDDPAAYEQLTRSDLAFFAPTVIALGRPFLSPAFPRPAQFQEMYTHALDRASLLTRIPKFERLDLQLIAMIEDARKRLQQKSLTIQQKIWIFGMSAGGSFTSRFTMLHPEIIQAASIGSPGWGPILPVAEWAGRRLPYPEGVADIEELTGKPLNLAALRQVALEFYLGDRDVNIDVWWDPVNNPECALINEVFNGGPDVLWRWPTYEQVFESADVKARWLIYPGVGHSMSSSWVIDMFNRNASTPPPPPAAKPLSRAWQVPHIQSSAGSEMRIVLVNTAAVAVKGSITALDGGGRTIGTSQAFDVAAESRRELVVSEVFANPTNVVSLLLQTDSGFLAIYARVRLGSQTFTFLPAQPDASGAIHRPGAGRIATVYLLNPGSEAAGVRLQAFDESGKELGSAAVQVAAKARAGGTVASIFGSDLPSVASFTFAASTGRIAAYVLGYAADGALQMQTAAPEYPR